MAREDEIRVPDLYLRLLRAAHVGDHRDVRVDRDEAAQEGDCLLHRRPVAARQDGGSTRQESRAAYAR